MARSTTRRPRRLESILDPIHFGKHSAERQKVLLPAWRLALLLREELRRALAIHELALPGRRMEAIAAVERHLAEQPDDQDIWGLKRLLYHDLTEGEYFSEAETWAEEPARARRRAMVRPHCSPVRRRRCRASITRSFSSWAWP